MEPAKEEVQRRLRFRHICTSSFYWTPLKIQFCEPPLCGLPAYPVSSQYDVTRKNYRLHINIYAALKFFTRASSCLET
jgi:hypothetical protein